MMYEQTPWWDKLEHEKDQLDQISPQIMGGEKGLFTPHCNIYDRWGHTGHLFVWKCVHNSNYFLFLDCFCCIFVPTTQLEATWAMSISKQLLQSDHIDKRGEADKENQQKTGLCWIKDLLEERLGGFNFLNVGFEAIILAKIAQLLCWSSTLGGQDGNVQCKVGHFGNGDVYEYTISSRLTIKM